jgi:class 3 adenylate cyclase
MPPCCRPFWRSETPASMNSGTSHLAYVLDRDDRELSDEEIAIVTHLRSCLTMPTVLRFVRSVRGAASQALRPTRRGPECREGSHRIGRAGRVGCRAHRRLFAKSPKEISDRIFTTAVFTDLSGSTEMLIRLGDARWRLLLAEHHEAVRAEIERFGGREAKTTGDGFLVLFPSPARAVRAAAMIGAATTHGLTTRVAVHAGEVELQGDEVRGIAVHSAARILGVAQPGEVLVSSTVRDLLSGSGLAFADRGEFELRGIDGRRSLAALIR